MVLIIAHRLKSGHFITPVERSHPEQLARNGCGFDVRLRLRLYFWLHIENHVRFSLINYSG